MLRGTYKVQDYVYYLRGYDFGDNIAFYLSTSTDKARRFIDKGTYTGDERLEDGIEYPASWEEIYISIGKGYIKVSKYTTSEGEKLYANRLNTDFFARLGGIVQGMVSNCNNKTRVDSIDSMLMNMEYSFQRVTSDEEFQKAFDVTWAQEAGEVGKPEKQRPESLNGFQGASYTSGVSVRAAGVQISSNSSTTGSLSQRAASFGKVPVKCSVLLWKSIADMSLLTEGSI